MLTLFYSPGACSRAVHIALEEAGVSPELRRVDLAAGQQREADYLRLNPKGRVPALVTDRGTLTETPAILLWIAQTWPAADLAPLDDPFALAELQAFNLYLCATLHIAFAHRLRGSRWADDPAALEAMRRKVPQNVTEGFAMIEDGFLRGPWVMGERYTIADAYLFTMGGWLPGAGVDIARFPRVAEHAARVAARPATQRAVARETAAASARTS
jgi:glutathione S-transferase